MRFARFAPAIAPLAIVLVSYGCGGTDPPIPRGAYQVTFSQPNQVECPIGGHNGEVGKVSATAKTTLVSNGVGGAEVSCSVIGSGSFHATGEIFEGDDLLNIEIGSISKDAKKDKPVKGTVLYASGNTAGNGYSSSDCSFYFEGTEEGVDEGKIWVSFECPKVEGSQGTCRITKGYAIFENCTTGKEDD